MKEEKKAVLRDKHILALLLKECLPPFKDLPLTEIEASIWELKIDEVAQGIVEEGLLGIVFNAVRPVGKEIIVNVKLVETELESISPMIPMALIDTTLLCSIDGGEHHNENTYCSIWICLNLPEALQGQIETHYMGARQVPDAEPMILASATIIALGKPRTDEHSELIQTLNALLLDPYETGE